MLNDLCQIIIVHLNAITYPLRELSQNEIASDWTETCNEAFEKLKFCMNSDACFSHFDESIYRV